MLCLKPNTAAAESGSRASLLLKLGRRANVLSDVVPCTSTNRADRSLALPTDFFGRCYDLRCRIFNSLLESVHKYRCYVRNAEDRTGPPVMFEAGDDAGALNKAAASTQVSLQFPVIEVWQSSRLLGQIPQGDHLDGLPSQLGGRPAFL